MKKNHPKKKRVQSKPLTYGPARIAVIAFLITAIKQQGGGRNQVIAAYKSFYEDQLTPGRLARLYASNGGNQKAFLRAHTPRVVDVLNGVYFSKNQSALKLQQCVDRAMGRKVVISKKTAPPKPPTPVFTLEKSQALVEAPVSSPDVVEEVLEEAEPEAAEAAEEIPAPPAELIIETEDEPHEELVEEEDEEEDGEVEVITPPLAPTPEPEPVAPVQATPKESGLTVSKLTPPTKRRPITETEEGIIVTAIKTSFQEKNVYVAAAEALHTAGRTDLTAIDIERYVKTPLGIERFLMKHKCTESFARTVGIEVRKAAR